MYKITQYDDLEFQDDKQHKMLRWDKLWQNLDQAFGGEDLKDLNFDLLTIFWMTN